MEILATIKKDHDEMRSLLKTLIASWEAPAKDQAQIIGQIRDEMVPHARAEELVVYNSMRQADAPTDKVYHGFKEHAEAEGLLVALETMDAMNVEWKPVAEKFAHALRHHMEEEEQDLFPQVRAAFAPEELQAMAGEFERLKPQYRSQSKLANTIEFVGNLIPPNVTDAFKGDGTSTKEKT